MLYPEFKWAPNYDNVAGLVSVEATIPMGDEAFDAPKEIGHFLLGLLVPQWDGLDYEEGYESTSWGLNTLTRLQLPYLRTTFCNGGWSGKVTIATRTTDDNFVNYNAIMKLTVPNSSQNRTAAKPFWADYVINYHRMRVIP